MDVGCIRSSFEQSARYSVLCEAQSSTEHCPHELVGLTTPSRPIGIRCRKEVAPIVRKVDEFSFFDEVA